MASDANTTDSTRAACLTPPGVGGIAVIQVVGPRAPALVASFVKAKHSIDLERMDAGQVRLCRWVDGDQTIDDALLTVRRSPAGQAVVDISLHGGPRIVQRALSMLKRAGARIVEPIELTDRSWLTANAVERELLPALLRAKTRAVASWLAQMAERLPVEVGRILHDIETDDLEAARTCLSRLNANVARLSLLLDGVRVVLLGEPNVGKSTLANALAGGEHALVSEVPGTTRDWVEHPAAVDGVPFTFVDTAGLRETTDPLEREAIRRSSQQMGPANVVLRVIDVSLPPTPADRQAIASHHPPERRDHAARRPQQASQCEETGPVRLFVWNKSDLPRDPAHTELMSRTGNAGVLISALTEAGLAELRGALSRAVRLTSWREGVSPVTATQVAACQQALSALTGGRPDRAAAVARLPDVVAGGFSAEDGPQRGYNQGGAGTNRRLDHAHD